MRMMTTNRTRRIFINANSRPLHIHGIEHQQSSCEYTTNLHHDLERFCCLHGANDTHQRCKYAHALTENFFKLLLWRKHTGIARRVWMSPVEDADLSVKTNRSTRNQRYRILNAGCIDRMARDEIITTIKNNVRPLHQLFQSCAFGTLL